MKWIAVAACMIAACCALMLEFLAYVNQNEDDVIEARPITLPMAPWGFFGAGIAIAVMA